MKSEYASLWALDPECDFLNHGSFGACPSAIRERQAALQEEIERQPVRFFARDLPERMEGARDALARFVRAESAGLAFVRNATTGVNTVLRSLRFAAGDELLVTNQEYNACRNALDFVAARWGARVVVVPLPFPVSGPDEVVDRVLEHTTPRTRLALIDHVTSATGLVLPVARLVAALEQRGVDVLVDGAHAPGMLDLDLGKLGAAYYTGNCHKWMCTPKGAALLYVREDKRRLVRPLTISHGANLDTEGTTRFRLEFDWVGTEDPTAYLMIPEVIAYLGEVVPGGWAGLREHNRALALRARDVLCARLDVATPAPAEMIGALAALPLPDSPYPPPRDDVLVGDRLQRRLREGYGFEVPVTYWPGAPKRVLRVSAQLYNDLTQYERLAEALVTELTNEHASLRGSGSHPSES
jgi:isopenicillin-N epimerase